MDTESSASEGGEQDYKVLFLGNGAVGKTSLIQRSCHERFGENYKQTIGLDFYVKRIKLPRSRHVTLNIWDIGGQEVGSSMINNYISGADAICFVYDVTNIDSLKDMEDWYNCVITAIGEGPLPLMVLVGNKIDLSYRQVSSTMHKSAAEMHKMDSFLVSAKSGEQINTLLMKLASKLCGISIAKEDLTLVDHVVATIESRPEERKSVFTATQTGSHSPIKNSNCTLM